MDISANAKSANKGFTLVEMLVVITIIGLLMAMTLGAVQIARTRIRNAAVQSEISQLKIKLEEYRNECGEYPPNFVDLNIVAERGTGALNDALQLDARNAVVRHLRMAFPRYVPGAQRDTWLAANRNPDGRPDALPFDRFANDVFYSYGRVIDPAGIALDGTQSAFDPASALLFWLGGLPEAVPTSGGQWIPAGFHADVAMPFKPGGPRTKARFEFDPERIVVAETHHLLPWDATSTNVYRFLRYYPPNVAAPYAYFKPRRRGTNWQYAFDESLGSGTTNLVSYSYFHSIVGTTVDNIAVPYRHVDSPPIWRDHDKFQIIAAGLDGQFGNRPPSDNGQDHGGIGVYRWTVTGDYFSPNGGDTDNLASFCKNRLQDEMQ
jgi:prepilin-type N-terminal cleavage/methylation domain-containing protein